MEFFNSHACLHQLTTRFGNPAESIDNGVEESRVFWRGVILPARARPYAITSFRWAGARTQLFKPNTHPGGELQLPARFQVVGCFEI
jgi:hypothetical protein